jgi:hypothetical protein
MTAPGKAPGPQTEGVSAHERRVKIMAEEKAPGLATKNTLRRPGLQLADGDYVIGPGRKDTRPEKFRGRRLKKATSPGLQVE